MSPSGKSRLAGVIGWPIAHSLSPRLHNFWLRRHGIDGVYVPLPVRPEDLAAAVRALPLLGFKGANVTVPHKEAVLAAVDEIEPAARRIGAVNTLVFEPDGRILGRNTDLFGFLENLRSRRPGWRGAHGPAVVLGAGGAARAVVAALLEDGAPEVRLVNRNLQRAEAVAAALGGPIRVTTWERRHEVLSGAALLVNTTSLGMESQPPLALSLERLPTAALVTDIVYKPLATPLLKQAEQRGHPIVDGIGMLLHQARPGFAAWFGAMPAVDEEVRAFVLGGL